jgi:hypothetical protein
MASRRRRPSCVLVAGDPRPDARDSGGEDEQRANTWFSRGQWSCLRATRIADGRIGRRHPPHQILRADQQRRKRCKLAGARSPPGPDSRHDRAASPPTTPNPGGPATITLTENGHLTRDGRLPSTHSGKTVATISVASDRRDRDVAGAVEEFKEISKARSTSTMGCGSMKKIGCRVKRRFGRCEPEIHSLGLPAATLTRDRSARTRPAR